VVQRRQALIPPSAQYIPTTNDLVIATITRSLGEYYNVQITPHAPPAILPQLAFEGATKKTRPQLHSGDVVYCRIASATKHADVELECFNSNTGKAEGLGPLKAGMLFDVSCQFARRLMMGKRGGVVLLEELAERLAFEVAIGRNGRVWVDGGEDVRTAVIVGRALKAADEEGLDEKGQREVVKRLMKGV
jgi:exosome complex component RRP40